MAGSATKQQPQVVYSGRKLSITREEISFPTGKIVSRDIVRHPGAVVIIPQQADEAFLLLRQFRFALGCEILEFPAGTLELHEPPLNCAQREIREEVKHSATNWTPLGEFYPAPGFCDEIQHGFLARNLSLAPKEQDEDEVFSVVKMTRIEVEKAILSGALRDNKSIAVFYRAILLGLI